MGLSKCAGLAAPGAGDGGAGRGQVNLGGAGSDGDPLGAVGKLKPKSRSGADCCGRSCSGKRFAGARGGDGARLDGGAVGGGPLRVGVMPLGGGGRGSCLRGLGAMLGAGVPFRVRRGGAILAASSPGVPGGKGG